MAIVFGPASFNFECVEVSLDRWPMMVKLLLIALALTVADNPTVINRLSMVVALSWVVKSIT